MPAYAGLCRITAKLKFLAKIISYLKNPLNVTISLVKNIKKMKKSGLHSQKPLHYSNIKAMDDDHH